MSQPEEDEQNPLNPGPDLDRPRSGSPALSQMSYHSMDSPMTFSSELKPEKTNSSTQTPRPQRHSQRARRKSSVSERDAERSSAPDAASMSDSVFSKGIIVNLKKEDLPDLQKLTEGSGDEEIDTASIFERLENMIHKLVSSELRRFQRAVSADCFKDCSSDGEDSDKRSKPRGALLDLTLHLLKEMNQEQLADSLKSRLLAPVCQGQIKSKLKAKFQMVFEGIQKPGQASHLDEIYTELYLTEGACQMNEEHEVTQIQMRRTQAIRTLKMFRPLHRCSSRTEEQSRADEGRGWCGENPPDAEIQSGLG
ncbi:uncharacterized protein LOC110168007 [Boleophthalmus pectinirostris]|uniref:uncharacterized protein LOC110168007 n=1 Tax=Boleophthalmus pectinirostris TaxID=150288 RepID=UPI00242D32CF|nr:uncharacterized protein LOC110168007 [Boleophthalmus pectinirostris]